MTWLLSIIFGDWMQMLVHATCILGIALFIIGIFARKIPFISNYGIILGFTGIALLLGGVYYEGIYHANEQNKAEYERLTKLIDDYKKNMVTVNEEIEKNVNTSLGSVNTTLDITIQDLIKDKEKIDNQCKVDEEVVDKLNFIAVFNNVSKETLDETP